MAQELSNGNVFITGSSGGIGSAAIKKMAASGYRVFAGVRNPDKIKKLTENLAPAVVPVKIDITDPASVVAAARYVDETVKEKGLAGLINNAGYILQGPLELLPIEEIKKQFDVNVFGQVRTVQAFLPLIRKAKGRIINIGAVTGKTAMPFIGVLSASKQAMEALTDALRVELRPWKIHVVVIEPAAMETSIFDKAQTSSKAVMQNISQEKKSLYEEALSLVDASMENHPLNPPKVVANAIHNALNAEHPRTRYAVGRGAGLVVTLGRFPDRLRDQLLIRALGLNKLSTPGKE
ncbi:SDR family oxidoreductase [Sporolactobacillus laevolacticus]|uniref:SDR family oxidoreductase n=1 Tax=Sporolactobacillus laevolacticus TaxID=33018 RepID=UPI0025B29F30|nr:SDR family oxidoreductase [Sporolactobacillus laevolacticus]MDN3956408.1 SDR family oxidoreductase [Sporolactobacillus laevolacticus]